MTKFLRPKSSPVSASTAAPPTVSVRPSDASVRQPDSNLAADLAGEGPDILIRISAPRTRPPAPSGLDAAGVPNPPVPLRAGMAHVCATGSGPTVSRGGSTVDVRISGAIRYDVAALNDVIETWSSSLKPSGTRASDSRRSVAARCQLGTGRARSAEVPDAHLGTRFRGNVATAEMAAPQPDTPDTHVGASAAHAARNLNTPDTHVGASGVRLASPPAVLANGPRRSAAARALGTITSAARPQRGTLALEEKVKC